jgi:hypothetical protein
VDKPALDSRADGAHVSGGDSAALIFAAGGIDSLDTSLSGASKSTIPGKKTCRKARQWRIEKH